MLTSYDAYPYLSLPYFESSPDRLRLVAHLFGLPAAPVERCRVLEVGCGSGGNLIPIAEQHPESRFLGIDLAPTQIAEGQATIAALGLGNIELRHADLGALPPDTGVFDYVIAHGVYSWVPPEVSAKLLDLFARHLAPGGVAYMSHDCKPGWYARRQTREIMLWHAGGFSDPQERVSQARAFLEFVVRTARTEVPALREVMIAELGHVRALPDWALRHSYLADHAHAPYFHELHHELRQRGLAYLGDADLPTMVPARFPPEVQSSLADLRGRDLVRYEGLLDLLRGRAFRMTLMCREGLELDRTIHRGKLPGLHLFAQLSEEVDGTFDTPRGDSLRPEREATREALRRLMRAWPSSVPYQALGDDLDESGAAADLAQLLATGLVRAQLTPSACGPPGERPRAAAHARLDATRAATVTNLRHESVGLTPEARQLLALLDGSRDRAALEREVGALDVDATLAALAVKGLLLA